MRFEHKYYLSRVALLATTSKNLADKCEMRQPEAAPQLPLSQSDAEGHELPDFTSLSSMQLRKAKGTDKVCITLKHDAARLKCL